MSETNLIEQQAIQEAINCISKILEETPFPVSIMVETSEDEAIMVGTYQSFIWMAWRILNTLKNTYGDGVYKVVEFDGCPTKNTPLGNVFNSVGHVVPSSLCITNNDDDSQKIVRFYLNY